nr:class I SAM-dependent methyltransferase [Neptunicella marina]
MGKCRLCNNKLKHSFVDLGMSPLCETFIPPSQLNQPEVFYPLHAYVCEQCLLVQVHEFVSPDEIYQDYPYFSSYSDSWVEHAHRYCENIVQRLGLDANSQVVEIASNDGYLLQHFVTQDIPCFGIEPATNVAEVARKKGINTENLFFGADTAQQLADKHGKADLLIGNNVLAHVPNLLDFIQGLHAMLSDDGVLTMEFPHLQQLIEQSQFDTIYHEHFCYLSLLVVEKAFAKHGLRIFDVEQLATHGGSLRIYACHNNAQQQTTAALDALRKQEKLAGLTELSTYLTFAEQVQQCKNQLLSFLINAKAQGKKVVGYGAPGKGNTLLNYCGIGPDLLSYTVDRSPHKQGKYTPGTRIPIYAPDKIFATQPDYVLILPWNLATEITQQMQDIKQWGAKFVLPVPTATVLD